MVRLSRTQSAFRPAPSVLRPPRTDPTTRPSDFGVKQREKRGNLWEMNQQKTVDLVEIWLDILGI